MSNFIGQTLLQLWRGLFPPGRVKKCKPDAHRWRSVAPPYARQCSKCGEATFHFDGKGGFPEGMEEYFDMMKTYRGPLDFKPIWICDCGAHMVIKTACDTCGSSMIAAYEREKEVWYCRQCDKADIPNTGLGPIWLCEQCGSWRKTNV
jgi:hypothetical protein